MNTSIAATIARTEKVLSALRLIGEMPEAAPFYFTGTDLNVVMLQFFPHSANRHNGCREIAKPFAKRLGGTWRVEQDKWESNDATFPGLDGTRLVIHYAEPSSPPLGDIVDLSEPESAEEPVRDEPDYDAPKALTPIENTLRNDEHFCA